MRTDTFTVTVEQLAGREQRLVDWWPPRIECSVEFIAVAHYEAVGQRSELRIGAHVQFAAANGRAEYKVIAVGRTRSDDVPSTYVLQLVDSVWEAPEVVRKRALACGA